MNKLIIFLLLVSVNLSTSFAGFEDDLFQASKRHPAKGIQYSYGTAGFRMASDRLDPVMFRVGILAALRSKKLEGKTIGVMITASHNSNEDNGVKLVDPMGEMLEESWEKYASLIANARTESELMVQIKNLIEAEKINLKVPAHVVAGRDTRPSGEEFVKSVEEGVRVIPESDFRNDGILTTPQLHYLARCLNTKDDAARSYGSPSEEGYYRKLARAFSDWMKDTPFYPSPLFIDAANGVGALKGKRLFEVVYTFSSKEFPVQFFNVDTASPEKLNSSCGADFVKLKQMPPQGTPSHGTRFAVFDGDADRLVYFYFDSEKKFHLLDGGKISVLIAEYLVKLVRLSGIQAEVGVVQTAYANGASSEYLKRNLQLPVVMTKTGVKHLHHQAKEYDIGIYFEANGHGTVLFKESWIEKIRSLVESGNGTVQPKAVYELYYLTQLINQAVGDALSDLLLVEGILAHQFLFDPNQNALEKWDRLYTDLPNQQIKVSVKNREIFVSNEDEQRLVAPKLLQEKIDQEVARYPNSRCFVRASGTEEAVRVYAEAETEQQAKALAQAVAEWVKKF